MLFRSDFTVEMIQSMGSDAMIARAARVSTGNDSTTNESPESLRGLLSFLMKNRHGTPFEHGAITLRVEVPIFIWREWHRHRIGFSYNEESGRYKKLNPVFYVPGEDRRKVSVKPADFKPSKPGFGGFLESSVEHWEEDNDLLRTNYQESYELYESLCRGGMDNGLARICLPVGIYSACYVTCNPRSLMAFLELRTDESTASRRSHPQWEMHQVAKQVEDVLRSVWPITHELWDKNGRVAP